MPGPRPIWPDEASLSLWALPPAQLTTTLVDLIEHGTGAAAYYADVMEAVVGLAVEAPGGPPASAADFLARLDPGWLAMAYSSGEHEAELALVRSAGRQIGDIALRFRTLLRRAGRRAGRARRVRRRRRLVLHPGGHRRDQRGRGAGPRARRHAGQLRHGRPARAGREILLAVDEFSAVSRRLPVWQLYERARSLGLAVQVSAQSWEGLAADEDERYRIAATADGGIWLLRTPHPEPVAALAGTRKVTDTTRQLTGRVAVWSHQGTSRLRLDPVVDPALIRALDVGQAGVHLPRRRHLPAGETAGNRARRGHPCCHRPGPATPATPPQAAAEHPPAPPARRATPAARRQFTARRGIRHGARPMTRPPAADPFRTLGLEPRADLTDDEVHAAWRRTASATHPDREDGGDPARFAQAAAAYTALRTRFGRGEVLADLQRPGGGHGENGRPVQALVAGRHLLARPGGAPGAARAAGPARARPPPRPPWPPQARTPRLPPWSPAWLRG